MKLATLSALILIPAAVMAAPSTDVELPLIHTQMQEDEEMDTEKQMAICQDEGGCALVTRKAWEAVQHRAYNAGVITGQKSCRSKEFGHVGLRAIDWQAL